MDGALTSSSLGSTWSGILQVMHMEYGMTQAHGQMVCISPPLEPDTKAMLYDWKVSAVDPFTLSSVEGSQLVYIPADEEATFFAMKEVCSGIGGIGMGAKQLGIRTIAALDLNPLVIRALELNGVSNPILGNIELRQDRFRLHVTPSPTRVWLACGFPCQPLSKQGDQRGANDPRSKAFHATLSTAWEQQASGLILECVPGAATADYIQQGLQCLAWSLGWTIVQRTLNLHNAWPCRRTRWWALLVPRPYAPQGLPDLPVHQEMQQVVALFPRWPIWTPQEEGLLTLTDTEKEIYDNPQYGTDIRHLQANNTCPCILHSYGVVLQACPCGCRDSGFAPARLLDGGIRGFYVTSMVTGKKRFLHVKEAAVLCGIDPTFQFPNEGRGSLCLVGQCASPIQAMWMLAQFFQHSNKETVNPLLYLTAYTMDMLRAIHGGFNYRNSNAVMRYVIEEQQTNMCISPDVTVGNLRTAESKLQEKQVEMRIGPNATVGDFRTAENKLQDWGSQTHVCDELGRLPDQHVLQTEAVLGSYRMEITAKKQRRSPPSQPISVTFSTPQTMGCHDVQPGQFLFEIADQLQLPRHGWHDSDTQVLLAPDQRIWANTTLTLQNFTAGGDPPTGLSDGCLDWMAGRLLGDATCTIPWMPCRIATALFGSDSNKAQGAGWQLLDTTQGLLTCVAIDGHWILLHLQQQDDALVVDCWNGLDEDHGSRLLPVLTDLAKDLQVRPVIMQHHQVFPQLGDSTCGTVALLHLGAWLRLWDAESSPDQLIWHEVLRWFSQHPVLVAYGPGGKGKGSDSDRDTIWALRDILHEHGVPEDRTEERANLAINKIGLPRLQQALQARNVWATMKALGSQPGVNFMWVKADELEAQIRRKAQSKFKVQPSTKKTQPAAKTRIEAQDIDISMLTLVPGAFVTEDNQPVTQIQMSEVQAHRAGLAYGKVEDIIPYLKEDKAISLDALGVLTTTRVPHHQAGLLPVTNLRIPALFGEARDPILIDGSLVNLGDQMISRHQELQEAPIAETPTTTLKIMIFRDESELDWATFCQSPIRSILQRFPLLILCKGQKCGEGCTKFHAPVDVELDSVVMDVWARSWYTLRGKRASMEEAEVFQAYIRIPQVCALPVQRLSGQEGFYAEPRQTDGKGPDVTTTVIWIPNATLPDAQHRFKTLERAVAITRFGLKYGIRTATKDAEQVHQILAPHEPFMNFDIQKVWELRPLPHGTQKSAVHAMLKTWAWPAKPMQPCKADGVGMGWLVGSQEDPPCCILPTAKGEVTVSLQRKPPPGLEEPTIWSSTKTRELMRKSVQKPDKQHQGFAKAPHPGRSDPWMNGPDPWAQYKPAQPLPPATGDVTMHAASMMDDMESRLKAQLTSQAASSSDPRLDKLEVDMREMKSQGEKFEHWFHDAGQQNKTMQFQIEQIAQQVVAQDQAMQSAQVQTQTRMEDLSSQVQANRKDVSQLQSSIQDGFANIEALLSKKHRAE